MAKKNKKALKSPQKKAEKFEHELPEIAKRLGIRVSSPYGYYPEDVDKIIFQLEKDVSSLTKENKDLRDELHEANVKSKALQTELTQIKMQVSLMEIPDASTEESFAMLSRISTITGKNEEMPSTDILNDNPNTFKLNIAKSNPIKPVTANTTNKSSNKSSSNKTTYSNLITPKAK